MLVDPNSESDIEQKIEQIISDKKLRIELSQKGLQQVKKFSWEKMAKEAIEVLTR